MTNYSEYKDARDAINGLINNREDDIASLEKEVIKLKAVRRMLDDEFKNRMTEKAKYLG